MPVMMVLSVHQRKTVKLIMAEDLPLALRGRRHHCLRCSQLIPQIVHAVPEHIASVLVVAGIVIPMAATKAI